MGESAPGARRGYLDHRTAGWADRFDGRQRPPRGLTEFPGPADDFELTLDGATATIHERHSGATWRLSLASPAP
jgi:hypothetical protein